MVPKDVLIYFYPENYIAFRCEKINLLDGTVFDWFEYSNIKINQPIDAVVFNYAPPAGVKVEKGRVFQRTNTADKIDVEKSLALINQPCPDFSLTDLNRRLYRFKKLKGKNLVLVFWSASWGKSVNILPVIQRLYERYKNNQNIRILTIARDDPNTIKKEIADNRYEFPVLIDRFLDVFRNKFFVKIVPMVFFIDQEGIVRDVYYETGDDDEEQLSKRIESLNCI